MKSKSLMLGLVLALTLTVSASAGDNYIFVGGQYDNDYGFSVPVGLGLKTADVLGGGLYTLPRIEAGKKGSLEADLGLFWGINDHWFIGPVFGGSSDFVGEEDPIAYLTGALGAAIGWMGKTKEGTDIGLTLGGRYKDDFTESLYYDGWKIGLVLNVGIQ